MAAVVASTVIGNSFFPELQCYLLASLREVTSCGFFCSTAKNFTYFSHLGFALSEYNALQGTLT